MKTWLKVRVKIGVEAVSLDKSNVNHYNASEVTDR